MGRTAGTQSGLQAVLGLATVNAPWWSAIFISEADAFQDDRNGHEGVHNVYRHYPGIGSWAMAFVIRSGMGKYVRSCMWRGRCGAIHFCYRGEADLLSMNIYIIGVHGAHGDLLADTFADLSFLMHQRPYGSKVAIVGDFNIDMLPTLLNDPWAGDDNREGHHADRRMLLDVFMDHFRLELQLPTYVDWLLGAPFADKCFGVPITRIPVGAATLTCKPSLLSYCVASHGLVEDVRAYWEGVPADHALMVTDCTPVYVKHEAAKTRWKCIDTCACIEWITKHCPESFADVDCFHAFLLGIQHIWGDRRSCKERRAERVPGGLRELSCTNR